MLQSLAVQCFQKDTVLTIVPAGRFCCKLLGLIATFELCNAVQYWMSTREYQSEQGLVLLSDGCCAISVTWFTSD